MGNLFLDIELPKKNEDEEPSVSLKNNLLLSSELIPQQNIDTSFPAGNNSQTFPPSMTNEVVSPMIPPDVQLGTPAPDLDRFVPQQFKVPQLQTDTLPNVDMTEEQSLVPNINPQTSGVTDRNGKFYFIPKPNLFGKSMPREISKAERNARVIDANKFVATNNAFSRGWLRTKNAANVLGTLVGVDPVVAAKRIAENNRITPEQPPEIRAGLERIMKSETWTEALVNVVKEPQASLSVFGESLPQMASSLGIFAAGTMAGQPWAGAGAAGLNTAAQSYAQVMLEELQKTGIDINNDAAVIAKFQDQAFWDEFRGKALQYGIPIGIFDALSMGFAGKIIQLAPKGVTSKTIASVGEVAQQGILGGAGEYVAQKTQELFGNRPEGVNKGEVMLEGLLELIFAPAEITAAVAGAKSEAKQEKEADKIIADRNAQMDAIVALDPNTYSKDAPNVSAPPPAPADPNININPSASNTNIGSPLSINAQEGVDNLPTVDGTSAQPVATTTSPGQVGQSFSKIPNIQNEDELIQNIEKDKNTLSELNNKIWKSTGRAWEIQIERKEIELENFRLQKNPEANKDAIKELEDRYEALNKEIIKRPSKQITQEDIDNGLAYNSQAPDQKVSKIESTDAPNQIKSTTKIIANPQRTDKPLPVQEIPNKPIVKVFTPDRSMKVSVKPVVVELSSLTVLDEQGAFQDRNRSAEAMQTIRENASRLTPETMLDDAMTDRGSPIIGKDGTVLSGNGRAMMMDLVFTEGFESQRKEYLDTIQDYGVNIEGFEKPILVRQMQDDMTLDEVKNFTRQSNIDDKTAMTTTETSARDADALTPEVILAYDGESLKSQNAPFVKSFVEQVVPRAERSAFVSDGVITEQGIKRVESAIFSYAFGERKDLINTLITNTQADNNIKALGNALKTTAIEFAKVKANIQKGIGDQTFDIAPDIASAAATIRDIRLNPNKTIEGFLETQETMDFGEADNAIEKALVKAFHHKTEAGYANKSIKDLTSFARYYSEFALEQKQDDFANQAGDKKPTPIELIERATAKVEQVKQEEKDAKKQRSLFNEGKSGDASVAEDGTGKQKPTGNRSSGGFEASNRAKGKELDNEEVRVDDGLTSRQDETGLSVREETGQGKQNKKGQARPPSRTRPGTEFIKASETNRQSIYRREAWIDANVDPNAAEGMGAKRQAKILSDLVKNKFQFKNIIIEEKNSRNAVNNLLDAYQNLRFMSFVLNISNEEIGLNGKLGLAFPEYANYLGAYFHQGAMDNQTDSTLGKGISSNTIVQPGRSNSFSHEWGHALDFHLMDKYSAEISRGITGRIKSRDNDGKLEDRTPQNLAESLGSLLNALYLDKVDLALTIKKKEQEIAKLKANMKDKSKPPKRIAILETEIDNIIQGQSRSAIKPSKYKSDAKSFAPKSDYWIRPTEMFARAFEAYIGHKVEAIGGTTEFIAKGDIVYQRTLEETQGTDKRLALTFPKEEERNNIFLAFDDLFEQLGIANVMEMNPEKPPTDILAYDVKKEEKKFRETKGINTPSIRQKILADQRSHKNEMKALKDKKDLRPLRHGNDLKRWEKFKIWNTDSWLDPIINSKRATLFHHAKRYKLIKTKEASEAAYYIEDLISRLTSDPGGTRITVKGGHFEEAVEKEARRFGVIFRNIVRRSPFSAPSSFGSKTGIGEFTTEQLKQLRRVLTSSNEEFKNLKNIDPDILAAGQEIRIKVLEPLYTLMRKRGIAVNYYVDGGYMPRMMDNLLVFNDENKFLNGSKSNRGAIPLFRDVIFPQEYGTQEFTDIETSELIARTGVKKNIFAELSEENQKIVKEHRSLFSELKRLMKDEDGNEKQILALQDEIEDKHAFIYEIVQNAFGKAGGQNWLLRLRMQQGLDQASAGVQGTFFKARKLPPETDTYMEDFYLDPIDSIMQYIPSVIRKAEFERRFGTHLVPKGFRRRTHQIDDKRHSGSFRNYLDYIIENKLAPLGLDQSELDSIRLTAELITGTHSVNTKQRMLYTLASRTQLLTTAMILPRAVLASIMEPFTVGVQTKKPFADGFKSLHETVRDAFKLTKTAKERNHLKQQMARILGVIDDPAVGEIITNKFAGQFADDQRGAAFANAFFVRIGLVGLTNAQRRTAMRIGFQFFSELSNDYRNGTAEQKRQAETILKYDYGVQYSDLDLFTGYMVEQLESNFNIPNAEDMVESDGNLSDLGEILSVSINRFVDMGIQNPKMADKARWAEHPLGRFVYGITAFARGFTRNVIYYSAKRASRENTLIGEDYVNGKINLTEKTRNNTIVYWKAIAPLVTLFIAHTAFSVVREVTSGSRDLEELEEKEGTAGLMKFILGLGLSRSGLTGGLDGMYNAILSLKYQRDLSNLAVGAQISAATLNIEKMFTMFVRNSPNTVSAEYQTLMGFYQTVIVPFLITLSANPAFSPISGSILGLGAAVSTSPKFRHWAVRNSIEAMTGEEYRPGGRNSKSDSNTLPF